MIRQFFKNAGLLAAAEIVLKLKGFIVIPLLTHHFGAFNYGVWAQAGVLVATFSPLIVLGTDSAIIRYLPGRPQNEQKRFFSSWLIFLFCISVLVCSLLYLWKHQIALLFFGEAGEYELFIPLAAATLFVGLLLNTTRNWFRVHNDAKVYSLVAVGQSLLGILAVLAMLIRAEGVYELVVYTLLGDLLVGLWLLLRIHRKYGWSLPDFSIIPSLLKFGLPLVPAAYAMWGLTTIDRLFLVKYGSLADIGIYSLAYALGYLTISIVVNPIWTMYPNSAAELYNKGDFAGLKKLFDYSVGLILLLTVPIIVGLLILGKPLVSLMATDEFTIGAPLMGIISIGYLFHMLASYYDVSLGLVYRQYLSTVSIVLAGGVNLILNAILIPKYLILGAAVATCLGFLSQFIFSLIMAIKYTSTQIQFGFPLKVLFVSMLMGIGIYGLSALLPPHGILPLLTLVLFGMTLYLFLLWVFKIIPVGFIKSALLPLRQRISE